MFLSCLVVKDVVIEWSSPCWLYSAQKTGSGVIVWCFEVILWVALIIGLCGLCGLWWYSCDLNEWCVDLWYVCTTAKQLQVGSAARETYYNQGVIHQQVFNGQPIQIDIDLCQKLSPMHAHTEGRGSSLLMLPISRPPSYRDTAWERPLIQSA